MKRWMVTIFMGVLMFSVSAGWFGIITASDIKKKFLTEPSFYVSHFRGYTDTENMDIGSVVATKCDAEGVWKITWKCKNGNGYWTEVYVWKNGKGKLCMRCNSCGSL